MLHPVGSLPPTTYWKRRAVGAGVLLLVVIVAFLLLTRGGSSEAAGSGATTDVGASAETPQLELVPAQPTGTGSAPTNASPSSTAAGTSAVPTSAAPTSGAPSSGVPTSVAPTSAAPTSAAPTSAAPPADLVPCTDETLAVVAGSPQASWAVAAEPVVTMTVTNGATQACTRDVGQGVQEWLLFSGETRVWGSNDCQAEPGADVRTLQPGDQVTLQIDWTGLTSTPGCDTPRNRLAPGAYTLVAVLGGDRSEPAPLTFT